MYKYYILIALGVLCVFLIPISYYNFIRKKEAKEKLDELQEWARHQHLVLDFLDVLPRLLIGLDRTNLNLLLLEGIKGEKGRIIELPKIISCELVTERSRFFNSVLSISLQMGTRVGTREQLVFYRRFGWDFWNAKRPARAAEKWQGIISKCLEHG